MDRTLIWPLNVFINIEKQRLDDDDAKIVRFDKIKKIDIDLNLRFFF
jgi:hypothetical protein